MTKCVICGRRPRREDGYCANCAAKMAAEVRLRMSDKPEKFLVYRGNVVGLFPNGDGMLRARLLRRSAECLPKSRTIFLDHYCPGFTREQIKRFKAAVLKLAAV